METTETWNRVGPGQMKPERVTKDSSTQTDCRIEGHGPRLSEVNLHTLLSLWMEIFPQTQPEDIVSQVRRVGLVVVRDGKVVGLHCSAPELHAGQAAIIQHGNALAGCQLYFSRRPCATCFKMLINVGVSLISFWPGDPEVSILRSDDVSGEAPLDAMATEILKSNSRPQICVLLEPLVPGLAQFISETSRKSDFMEVIPDQQGLDTDELYNKEWRTHLKLFSGQFLVKSPQQHQKILTHMGLENFGLDPCFSNLRNNMRELVEVLAAVAAGLPQQHYGFYREQRGTPQPSSLPHPEGLPQEVARHCIIQARLLSHRTEDPKVGVGAVIWSTCQSAFCDGTGHLYLLGCGYNAYPAGSQYAEYPQLDSKQEGARQRRKYRYIVHAEQNALTSMNQAANPEEASMLFVTKCPCDECVPLIRGAGITHIYTTDQDRDKDKGDISYLKFSNLNNINKFTWQRSPSICTAASSHQSNGVGGKHSRQAEEDESPRSKKMCGTRSHNLHTVS
eukprot:XP_011604376.1 PREDICTED: cytidine and dCMP deaminase domain-containing protein 1 isoform X2 [Takifugu rubripes]